MPNFKTSRAQLKIDFEVDERVEELATDFVQKIGEGLGHLNVFASDAERKTLDRLSADLAGMAWRKFARHEEPGEVIMCHGCDCPTRHDERVRVVVCVRCATRGGSPGSGG